MNVSICKELGTELKALWTRLQFSAIAEAFPVRRFKWMGSGMGFAELKADHEVRGLLPVVSEDGKVAGVGLA